jgi:ABC-type proline/glycine betaine transport system substrate-binding protein
MENRGVTSELEAVNWLKGVQDVWKEWEGYAVS